MQNRDGAQSRATAIRRPCPICGGGAASIAFPYAVRFNEATFDYVACGACGSVFIDPVPDERTFEHIYAKSSYHDHHYAGRPVERYVASARLLRQFLPERATVLDYGCGLGAFLEALAAEGFRPTGVEFDEDAAAFAASITGYSVYSTTQFRVARDGLLYDAIHLGDVLEHLPHPALTLMDLLRHVRPGGLLFAEGPLENNPSPVYWSAKLFGAVKRRFVPYRIGSGKPTHLFRIDAERQLAFFFRVQPCLQRIHWQVEESGWPYADGGAVKRAVAATARALGGRRIFGATFGNRFRAVFRLPSDQANDNDRGL